MDQKKSPERFKDTDYATVLTLTFEDKARAEAVAATFNAACKSGRCVRGRRLARSLHPNPTEAGQIDGQVSSE
jgi:hypothetical protein